MGKSKDLATRVGIDDNADATAITITSQENVGIGTASPSNYGAAYTSLGVSGSSASAIEGFVGSNLVGYLQAYNAQVLVGSKTNVPLKLVTNDTIQMTIDGSGRVTMPSQPAFDVARPNQSSGDHTWNQIHLNRGSHYNSSNGRFTAPVAGVYIFFHGGIKGGNSTTTSRLYLKKNGSRLYDSRHLRLDGATNQYGENGSVQWIVQLAVNDYIQAETGGGTSYTSSGEYNVFGGYLIG